jgi:hypothetical protein
MLHADDGDLLDTGMIMSFFRSTMKKYPSASRIPTSPVWNHPSISTSAVASGRFQ